MVVDRKLWHVLFSIVQQYLDMVILYQVSNRFFPTLLVGEKDYAKHFHESLSGSDLLLEKP